MEFDTFTVVLLRRGGTELSGDERARYQDLHLDYQARLVEQGHSGALGPTEGDDERELRGICIMRCGAEEALRLQAQDPLVQIGFFTVEVHSWRVPAGGVLFGDIRFPHSVAEVVGA